MANSRRDQDIAQIVANYETSDYDDAIANCEDPAIFWNLSSIRKGLLGWLPLPQGCRILEIGAGFGAPTAGLLNCGAKIDAVEWNKVRAEALRRRFKGREDIDVLCQDALSLKKDAFYDGIVLARIPKSFIGRENELWDLCARLLKNDGFVLAGFNNRFGLRYWRGGVDDRAPRPFASLENRGGGDGLYSRTEFDAFALRAGLRPQRCFYPFPNDLFPLTIYTDRDLPGKGMDDRLFDLDPWGGPVVLEERLLCDALFREGLLPAMADYAMVLFAASEDYAARGELGAVDRVVLSPDRGKERSAVVRLFSDGRVEKAPLDPEGVSTLRTLYETQETLRARGVPVVEETLLANGVVRMPRLKAPTLLEHLGKLQEKEPLLAIFDRLEQDILRSAPLSSAADSPADSVLETGYIDMTPFNIFWLDGELLYFDQEFCQSDCPVGYVLYRALRYAYYHVPSLENLASLEEMKNRYRIAERWNEYETQENAFIEKTRRQRQLRQVYRWAETDRAAIETRRASLLQNRETSGRRRYRVGLLMGVFDMFHVGHLRLIERAKGECEYLRVAVLSDELVRKFKQKDPIIPQDQRMQVLAALRDVDEVVCIEDIPSRIMEFERRPFDCFFSGDDYRDNEYWNWEREELRKRGSDIKFFSYTEYQSSTMIRAKLNKKEQ